MKKTICILSYPRTGSNWLCEALEGPDSFSSYELFNEEPLQFYSYVIFLMNSVYRTDSVIVDHFSKVFAPVNFNLSPQIKIEINQSIRKAIGPYSIDFFHAVKKLIYSIDRNFVFKVFPQQIERNSLDLNQLVNSAEYTILNYRNNLLDSFISLKKASLSEHWFSFDKHNYLEKIQWDRQEYQAYATDTLASFKMFKDACEKIPSKVIYLSYEEIHQPNLSHDEKIKSLNNRFLQVDPSFDWCFKSEVAFQKENYIQNLEDNFLNPEDFLKDYPNLRTTIFPKNQSHLPSGLQKLDWASDSEETVPPT